MAIQIDILLVDNPSNNDNYSLRLVSPNDFYDTTKVTTFKTTPTTADHVQIGVNLLATVGNLFTKVTADYIDFPFINVIQEGDTITITINEQYSESYTVGAITGDIEITHTEIPVEYFTRDNIILSRSPFNIILQPTSLFDLSALNLKIYRGEQTVDAPATDTSTRSKAVIQAGQDKVRFEVSKLLNDYTKNSIPTFGSTGVQTSSSYDSVWVDGELLAYYLDTEIGTASRQYLAIDGFGWHTELYNPKLTTNVLTTNTSHIIYRGSDYPLYFVSLDLVSITVNGVTVPFTLDATFNNQIIAYINIGAYVGVLDSFTAVFTYAETTETHTFTVKDECRYPLYNCFFKNKYGFWQSIPFNLRSKTVMNVESTEYMPVVSVYGEYSLTSHNNKTYQPSAKETITCNTDFLPEYYNDIFRELMVSEFVYLENEGVYLPVNLNKKTFEKKTRKFDKLIQYTFDFDYSFNTMNTVI